MRWLVVAAFVAGFGASAGAWEPVEDHPNPIWARPWINLNGEWRFDFDPDDAGVKDEWFKEHAFSDTINVPYPWQSTLSGIGDTEYQGAAWYERDVTIPEDAERRVFLMFGAIDWEASVWVNGSHMADHVGGYTPFEVELTGAAKPGETVRVTVRAYDVTDPETPNGKQTGWYTRTGGIWQTVYLEWRGESYVRSARVTTDTDKGEAVFACAVDASEAGEYRIDVVSAEEKWTESASVVHTRRTAQLTAGEQIVEVRHEVPNAKLWSPDFPTLYGTRILLRRTSGAEPKLEDAVQTYFGLRRVSRGPYNGSDFEYILLNDKPIYLRGALHQSFNPDGIYTHPNDDYIRRDYEKAKEFGLNFIRIHIKVDEPRCMYWADKLGILLMCDIPNYQRHTDRSMQLWEDTLRATIDRDFNHPSIFSWCDFNETWGIRDGGYDRDNQEWVRDMYLLTKELDPTRLAEDNSPCRYDHVETDINSWHFYIDNFKSAAHHISGVVEKTFPGSDFNYAEGWKQSTAPLINSEYGGVSAGSGDRDISWVFLFLTNLLRKYDKIGGYVYTELEDIEWEHNGFMNYDRSDKNYHYPAGITLADLQQDDFAVLDCPPYQRVEAGSRVSVPVLLSHWSEREGLRLRITADGKTVDGRPWSEWVEPQERDASGPPFRVTPQGSFEFELPDASGILNCVVEVLVDGERCAANYCVFDVRDGATWQRPGEFPLAVPVKTFSAYSFEGQRTFVLSEHDKVHGRKSGFVEYRLRLPRGLKARHVEGCRLVAEIGSKAGDERRDWPRRRDVPDYPQTDGKKWPTDVVLSVNGVPFHEVTVGNDYADARGVLSHVADHDHGSCGEIVEAPITGTALAALKKAIEGDRVITLRYEVPDGAAHTGGIALYGAGMGQHPAEPTLVFQLKQGARVPKDKAEPLDTVATRIMPLIERGPKSHTSPS